MCFAHSCACGGRIRKYKLSYRIKWASPLQLPIPSLMRGLHALRAERGQLLLTASAHASVYPTSFARRSGITLLFWLFLPDTWANSCFLGFSRPAPGQILAFLASLARRLGRFLLYWFLSPSAWADSCFSSFSRPALGRNSCFSGFSRPVPGQILAFLASLARRLGVTRGAFFDIGKYKLSYIKKRIS